MKTILEAINLTKKYEDNQTALNGISFRVNEGEIFTMLGGNGAGKTTTINLFLNLIEPTEGEAFINGVSAHKDPLEAKKYISYVSENVMLYNNFTAYQNLDYFARLCGRTSLTKDDYREVLNRVGLQEEAHNRKLKTYSKGMRQKCGIAIAIIKNAPAVILDEPTSGLDPKAGYEFIKLLETLRDEGKAILMSTHDIFRAKEISTTIGIMNRGSLVMQRPASDLAGEDLEKLYLEYMAGEYVS